MNHDEARTLLVEQGALVIKARVNKTRVENVYREAVALWLEAAEPLLDHDIAALPVSVQREAFRESAVLAGFDPDDPELEPERRGLQSVHLDEAQTRLDDQRVNAELN